MNHEQALQAARMIGAAGNPLFTDSVPNVVRAYLEARAVAVEQRGSVAVWRDGFSLTVAELLADFGEDE